MISVELMTGDMSVGADGTITCIDGNKVYAFGHRFLAVGPTDLPFTRSEVIALLANVNTSFKISSGRELMGVISQDRDTAIAGALGKRADMLPLDIEVTQDTKQVQTYHMKMVNDRYLSPVLFQMALFSAIDATERSQGVSSVVVRGAIEFENRKEKVELQNIYAGDGGSAMVTSTSTAIPLAYLMQAGFDELKVKRISLQLESFDVKKALNIGQVYLSRKEVKPGDTIELMTQLEGGERRGTDAVFEIPDPARDRAWHALLHGRGRFADRPRGVETDHQRNAALAGTIHLDGGPVASER